MEQDHIWDFYQSRTPEIFDENTGRLRFLAKRIGAGEKVLDIGIGNGTFERLAKSRGAEVFCLDPSAESIERAKRELNMDSEHAKCGYSQAIPFSDSLFDAVVMSEVLEHLSDEISEPTLREVKRVLKPGGRLLATVPAREDLAINNVVCPHCDKSFHRWGHVRSFTPESFRALLSPNFDLNEVKEKKFITWERRKGAAKVAAAVKIALNYFGVRLPDESLFACATKVG
jgi:SAM-dependent methyltransferase